MNKPYCESNDNFKQTETKKNNKDIPIPKPQKENKSQIEALEVSSGENITMPSHHRNIIFVMFLLSNLFLNYDTGVIPASLLEIVKEINLDYKEQALLGSLVYLGLSFASLFVHQKYVALFLYLILVVALLFLLLVINLFYSQLDSLWESQKPSSLFMVQYGLITIHLLNTLLNGWEFFIHVVFLVLFLDI